MATNREHFGAGVEMAGGVADDLQDLLFDPQTSGGLLIAVGRQMPQLSDEDARGRPEFGPVRRDRRSQRPARIFD